MNLPKLMQRLFLRSLLPVLFFLSAGTAFGQVQITGTVYDVSQRFAMIGVSVMGNSGIGTTTDSLGHYSIRLPAHDSIYFSYLGKSTSKFFVGDVPAGQPFDMALQVSIDSLPTAYVRSRNYLTDSLENRKEYAKVFNYQANTLTNMKMTQHAGLGVGLDMDMFFNGKERRRMEAFQTRLEEEEHDKYVDHKFTRAIVKKITGLDTPALDTFMKQYRPTYEFIQSCATEYEFYHYIQEWGKFFNESWKEDHPDKVAAKKPEQD
jgi:hypothetical protein